jgi:hypothetical protein
MPHGSLKSVVLWVLPNYAAIAVLIALAFLASSISLRVQHTLEGFWMLFALLLPISTIMAAFKAVQLSLRGNGEQPYFWMLGVGWGLVAVAVGFNVFSFMVISRTLR